MLSHAQIAVLRETEGQGPFCSLVLAVVVVKDVVVFVAFATNLEVASAVRAVKGDEVSKPLIPLQDFVISDAVRGVRHRPGGRQRRCVPFWMAWISVAGQARPWQDE